jgi:hypothetical protein
MTRPAFSVNETRFATRDPREGVMNIASVREL